MSETHAAVFMDRDGTINEEVSFLSRMEQLKLYPQAAEAIRLINEAGMKAASLYHHFASKDAIVAEVLRIGVEQVFGRVQAAVEALPPDAGADALLQTAVHEHLQGMHGLQDYTSANTIRLDLQQTKDLLMTVPEMRAAVEGGPVR